MKAEMSKAKEEFSEYERKDIKHMEYMKHSKEQVRTTSKTERVSKKKPVVSGVAINHPAAAQFLTRF